MHHLLQSVLIPQMTEIISCPDSVPSNETFAVTLQLYDQFGPINFKLPHITVYFTKDKNRASKSAIECQVKVNDQLGTRLEITPQGFGKLWLHVLINDCEIPQTAFIDIVPSADELVTARMMEEMRAKEESKEKEKQEKLAKAELEKKKAMDALEEANRRKKEETEKRAQESLKSHRAKQDKEREDKERERKQKLEMKTGGGYDLNKRKK